MNSVTQEIRVFLSTKAQTHYLKRSRALGYATVPLYLKALLEQFAGEQTTTPLSPNAPLVTNQEKTIMVALQSGPLTISQLRDNTGKWPSAIRDTIRRLQDFKWVDVDGSATTGGRYASTYYLTPAGKERLRLEGERLAKKAAMNEAIQKQQMAESAYHHPDPKRPQLSLVEGGLFEITPEVENFFNLLQNAIWKYKGEKGYEAEVDRAVRKAAEMIGPETGHTIADFTEDVLKGYDWFLYRWFGGPCPKWYTEPDWDPAPSPPGVKSHV